MQIQELHTHLDRLREDTAGLQKVLLYLGCALFLAFFLPWGIPGLGARWEMDLFVDIWPFVWAFGFGAIGAATLLKLPFRPRPFGIGVALLAFSVIGLLVVSFKLAGDGTGFMNALALGTIPYFVTGALGHLGFFSTFTGLYLQQRHPDWAPARYLALAGGALLLLGMLVPGKTSGDSFPLAILFRQASGAELLVSLYVLAALLATLGLAALPLLPKDKVPAALGTFAPGVLLALLPPAWVLYWIFGSTGSWQDLYSVPHRVLLLGGLLGALCLGVDLLVAALRSPMPNRFVLWDLGPAALAPEPSETFAATPTDPGNSPAQAQTPCPMCGADLEWVAQYERWYCHRCSQYL